MENLKSDIQKIKLFWQREIDNHMNKFTKNNSIRLNSKGAYCDSLQNLNDAVFCMLRSNGISASESNFILKKFRNIKSIDNKSTPKEIKYKSSYNDEHIDTSIKDLWRKVYSK